MSTNARTIFAIVSALVLAALSVPQVSSLLPPGTGPTLSLILAGALHKLNAEAPAPQDGGAS